MAAKIPRSLRVGQAKSKIHNGDLNKQKKCAECIDKMVSLHTAPEHLLSLTRPRTPLLTYTATMFSNFRSLSVSE